jgi:hypothetical protein
MHNLQGEQHVYWAACENDCVADCACAKVRLVTDSHAEALSHAAQSSGLENSGW